MTDLARHLRRLVTTNDFESDASLLDRFIVDRDGLAFAALVSRHGPMVLAVCRRVLGHRQDAEDAFQATFLVLARRAEAVKPRSLLGNWLYGVAYRTARAARRVALARRVRETKAAAMRAGDAAPDDTGLAPELREALDRELAALPDVYRAALVACDLEELSRREAAVRLGWSEGTLSSRLARARSLLARRLCRYGLAVPAAGLASVAAPAVVASELAEPTVRLGTLVAAGEAVVAAPVAALMEGAMGTMFLTKLKTLAAVVVVGCAVAMTSVAGWRADAAGAADPPKAVEAPKRAERRRTRTRSGLPSWSANGTGSSKKWPNSKSDWPRPRSEALKAIEVQVARNIAEVGKAERDAARPRSRDRPKPTLDADQAGRYKRPKALRALTLNRPQRPHRVTKGGSGVTGLRTYRRRSPKPSAPSRPRTIGNDGQGGRAGLSGGRFGRGREGGRGPGQGGACGCRAEVVGGGCGGRVPARTEGPGGPSDGQGTRRGRRITQAASDTDGAEQEAATPLRHRTPHYCGSFG